MSKPRLPLSVLAALGLSAAGVECTQDVVMTPCLSIRPIPDPDDDTAAAVNQQKNDVPPPTIGPCLSPVREPDTGRRVVPPVERPKPAEPEMTVCLSIAPPPPQPLPEPPASDDKSDATTVDKAKQAVLKRGILPPDVAARLHSDSKD